MKTEIEDLFVKNIKNILNSDYLEFDQIGKGTFHSKSDLPNILKSWDQNIFNTVKKYQKINKRFIKNRLDLLSEIEKYKKKIIILIG